MDLSTQDVSREVVDGQQRLRSLIAFIDPESLPDFDEKRDRFVVPIKMNADIGEKTFKELDPEYQQRILGYTFSVQVLGSEFEDRDILEVFARLNSTGYKLTNQELRNAEYFGEFKMVMYSIALQQFERWRRWKVMTDDQLSRMEEVQLVSDLVMNMMKGLIGRSQKAIGKAYKDYDQALPGATELERRFQAVMDSIDSLLGKKITSTIFTSEIHFFTLFVYLYDVMWGLASKLSKTPARQLPPGLGKRLLELSRAFKVNEVPEDVLDAVQRASTDLGRRRTRFEFMTEFCAPTQAS